ncbi:MAG: nucleotidyltransferase family protein [Firmicutes bacterium]|nr:nucleotidyltransferase family protein [Bacillota bacterium]
MSLVGIIGEYNPFHRGHEYLISSAKAMSSADLLVSVMSGDFTQRGTPAVFDKWKRAEAAVKGGINLVLELPQIYAVSHAGDFAMAGVTMLDEMGCDYIAFGSECGDEELMSEITSLVIEAEGPRRDIIEFLMQEGISYPEAREAAVRTLNPEIDLTPLFSSNDILGIEYLKAMRKLDSYMVPLVVKRMGDNHLVSATAAREEIKKDPNEKKRIERMDEAYFDIVRTLILEKSAEEIENVPSAGEGLANKLKQELRYASSLDDLIGRVKSKRYTYTRISRLLAQMVLGMDRSALADSREGLYFRALAFDEMGAELLRCIHDGESEIPIMESPARIEGSENFMYSVDVTVRASDIYNIIQGTDMYGGSDYVRKPIYMRGESLI